MKHPWFLYSMKWQTRAFLYENGLDAFSKICKNVLEKHAPRKKRFASKSITLKSQKQLLQVQDLETAFWKKEVMKIDSYFVKKRKKVCITATKSKKILFCKFKQKSHNWKQMFLENR